MRLEIKPFSPIEAKVLEADRRILPLRRKRRELDELLSLRKRLAAISIGRKDIGSGNVLTGRKNQAQRNRTKLPHQSQL
jgi:hypothetical protein